MFINYRSATATPAATTIAFERAQVSIKVLIKVVACKEVPYGAGVGYPYVSNLI